MKFEENQVIEASGEMIREKFRVEQQASARERIDDEAKRFENLKSGENQVIEATGYADTVLNVLRDNYIPEYTMVTLGMILIMMMIFKMFETCFRWKKGPIVKDERTFGLRLASNNYTEGLPKWDPRSQTGVYVGMSPNHASSVALVLNLATCPKIEFIRNCDH